MKIQALKFISGSIDGGFFRHTLDAGSDRDIADLRDGDDSVVCLVKNNDLAHFMRLHVSVIDRGVKNKHKGLSEYLIGRGKESILIINGNYATSVQLQRSIRAFCSRAQSKSENNLNIIGAEKAIFEQLWERSEAGSGSKDATPDDVDRENLMAAEASPDNTQTWLLLQLKERHEEPSELRKRYIGRSIKAQLVRQMIMRAAQSDEPVLILGDTGTGKELVAREIHKYRSGRAADFIPVNCGAIPRELFETELFGHAKGAFTDARYDKKGLWEMAGNGTLFLDEIGDLHPMHQVKILRVLENKRYTRVGETKDIEVSARVITATNRDLFSMVQSKDFREDLYYRLRGMVINLPALREHPADIPLLAQHFWKKITNDPKMSLSQEILDELQSHNWPGNARELKMVLNNLKSLFGAEGLGLRHLQSVFYLDGHNETPQGDNTSENEIALHRARCLRHLKRADEAVRASRVTILPVVEEKKTDGKTISSVRDALSYRLNELEMLTLKPLLFYSEESFSAVHGLKGKLAYFLNLLQDDCKSAHNFWKKELENEFKIVLSTVFKEVEKVIENG
jgi:transcriptional regulator with PAS, ATPase and Fis domain